MEKLANEDIANKVVSEILTKLPDGTIEASNLGLPQTLLNILPNIKQYADINLFLLFLSEQVREAHDSPRKFDFSRIATLMQNAIHKTQATWKSLIDFSILLSDIDYIFDTNKIELDVFNNDMLKLCRIENNNSEQIIQPLEEIRKYRRLQAGQNAAAKLLEYVESFGLQGDYSKLKFVQSLVRAEY